VLLTKVCWWLHLSSHPFAMIVVCSTDTRPFIIFACQGLPTNVAALSLTKGFITTVWMRIDTHNNRSSSWLLLQVELLSYEKSHSVMSWPLAWKLMFSSCPGLAVHPHDSKKVLDHLWSVSKWMIWLMFGSSTLIGVTVSLCQSNVTFCMLLCRNESLGNRSDRTGFILV